MGIFIDSELQELIFAYYQNTLDLTLSMDKFDLNPEQCDALLNDEEFMIRIKIQNATEYDNRLLKIREIADNSKDSRSLKANLELLKLLFGNDIYNKENPLNSRMPTKIVLTGVKA